LKYFTLDGQYIGGTAVVPFPPDEWKWAVDPCEITDEEVVDENGVLHYLKDLII
jgi:hypothetical protein